MKMSITQAYHASPPCCCGVQALPEYKDCYEDINLLPEGEHLIEPGKSFNDAPKCQPTVTLEMNL